MASSVTVPLIPLEVNLNIIPIGMPPIIHLSQYDKGIRQLVFHLFEGAKEYEIPSNATVTFRGTKPDRTGFEYPCLFSGNTVMFGLQDQVATCSGNYRAEVKISVGENHITSAYVNMHIKRAALSEDTVISETELPMLEKAVEAYDRVLDVEQATKESENNSEYYAKQAADAKVDVEQIRTETNEALGKKQDQLSAGNGVALNGSVLSVKPATTNAIGGVKVGTGLEVSEDGTLNTKGDTELGLSVDDGMLLVEYEEDV